MITLLALVAAMSPMLQNPPYSGLTGDPQENYREAVRCYGLFAATATIQREVGEETGASEADTKARAFMGLAGRASRDAGVNREVMVSDIRNSPSLAVEPLRGSTDPDAITAFVESLNSQTDTCIAFVQARLTGTS